MGRLLPALIRSSPSVLSLPLPQQPATIPSKTYYSLLSCGRLSGFYTAAWTLVLLITTLSAREPGTRATVISATSSHGRCCRGQDPRSPDRSPFLLLRSAVVLSFLDQVLKRRHAASFISARSSQRRSVLLSSLRSNQFPSHNRRIALLNQCESETAHAGCCRRFPCTSLLPQTHAKFSPTLGTPC